MHHRVAASLVALAVAASAAAQTPAKPRTPVRRPAPLAPPIKEAPEVICPTPLGMGLNTKLQFCDVMSERDVTAGVIVRFPEHKGPVTLSFDLHNRHTYSEEQVKANRAFARYTATVGVLTMDNTLVSRAAVQSEFRTAADLIDRIAGGAGPGGVKAVAPVGTEHVRITIPEEEDRVGILGEKLTVERLEGPATYSSAGRPIAVISNVQVEYRPGPPRPARRKTPQ